MKDNRGGYILLDCGGLNLASSSPQTISGSWARAKAALAANKPIVAGNCKYSTAPVSPVSCFGWAIAADEIVIVGATLHIHVKDDNTCTVLDVVGS